MVFVQLAYALVGLFSGERIFNVNLQGNYKCKVKYIDYSHSGNAHEMLRFQSSKFRFPNSTYSDSIIVSNVEEWKSELGEFIIYDLNGYIDIKLTELTLGGPPSNFVGYVIGLELEPLDDPVSKLNYNKGQ